eukprot:15233408-Alexandrium_andersonii.AAC.1
MSVSGIQKQQTVTPGVARHRAAWRHDAPRVLLRNRAVRGTLQRKALQRDVGCNARRCDAESAPRC